MLCVATTRKEETAVRVFRNATMGGLQSIFAVLVATLETRTSVGDSGGTSVL